MIEKLLFLDQISEMEILIYFHVMNAPESENHIFNTCLCVCVSVCVYVCYKHNVKNYNKNIKFISLHLYHTQMLLESFYKDR